MIDRDTTCPEGFPEHLWPGFRHYVLDGQPTGQFIQALFSNDLFDVIARGDEESVAGLTTMVRYIYNHCPTGCHGSRDHVKAWVEQGGMARRTR